MYYIGSTSDVLRRLSLHDTGRVRSTKPYKPWVLKYQESYKTLKDARRREKQIKSWHSRTAIEKLLNQASSSSG